MATYFSMMRGYAVGDSRVRAANETRTDQLGLVPAVGPMARARRVLMGVGLVSAPLAFALTGPVDAQGSAGESAAETAQTCVTVSFHQTHLLNSKAPRTPTEPLDLPEGVVSIPEAHSWDGYPSRVDVVQSSEIWEVEFIGADGSIVGVSSPTQDVEDYVAEGHWNGSLGDVTLSAPATGVRAHHRPDLFADNSPNSVYASDITVCWQAEIPIPEPPTTEPPTTEPPTTVPPTTAPGDACPLGSDGNPIDSNDPNCPVTTTVPSTTTTVEPPPPSGPTTEPACPLDSDGNPVDPSDPDCPQPTTTIAPATTAPPPKGPTLPVTGSESTLLLLSGLWMLGAGSTMVAYSRTR